MKRRTVIQHTGCVQKHVHTKAVPRFLSLGSVCDFLDTQESQYAHVAREMHGDGLCARIISGAQQGHVDSVRDLAFGPIT